MNQLPTFVEISVEQYNAAKDAGKLPLAKVTVVRSDYPDAVTGLCRVFFAEIVSNPEARWIVKDTRDLDGEALSIEVEDIKHAFWSAVEDFHQQRHEVLAHGLHVRAFDITAPEVEVGYVAAWNTEPKYAAYMPNDGWASLKWRNGHFVKGAPAIDSAATKHDYMDMLLVGSANFRVFLPKFLDLWAEEVVKTFKLGREESIEHSAEKQIGWAIKDRAYQAEKRMEISGNVPQVKEIGIQVVEGEEPIDLETLELGTTIHAYALLKLGGKNKLSYMRSVTWDGTDKARAKIASLKACRFSRKDDLA